MLRSCNWNWVNVEKTFQRKMDNSLNWSWWILEQLMMCSSPHFAPIGGHVRKMVKTIPLMYFVVYWLRINKSLFMRGSLVVTITLTCSRERARIITRKEDVHMLLEIDKNVSTRKINGKLMSRRPCERIRKRKHIANVERWDMWRKCVGIRDQT